MGDTSGAVARLVRNIKKSRKDKPLTIKIHSFTIILYILHFYEYLKTFKALVLYVDPKQCTCRHFRNVTQKSS